jgi:hypothetical protein
VLKRSEEGFSEFYVELLIIKKELLESKIFLEEKENSKVGSEVMM